MNQAQLDKALVLIVNEIFKRSLNSNLTPAVRMKWIKRLVELYAEAAVKHEYELLIILSKDT